MDDFKLKLLSKKPIGEDLFEGKSQENIANIISENVKCNNDNHKMIGIEGKWGSGKSNVIELLRNRLDKSKYKFFVYDVWGHQEDLQRKSILQELINFLTSEDRILKKKDYWTNKVKELTGTKIETKKISSPKLSFGICVTFFLFVLIPVFESLAETKVCFKEKIPILLIPIFIIAGLYLIYIFCAIFTFNKNENKSKLKYIFCDSFSKIINVYKDNEIESSATEFTHECNPSVVEFNTFMSDLSKAIQDSSKETHLIIVFDNMDRLPIENVKSLWSSIHTFYSERKYPNITTVVTFDREHIKSAFAENGDDEIGNDYINKTFDIVYRVSQPILTDWKLFLKKMWKEAFNDNVSMNEYSRVEQAYDFLGDKDSFTPRQIISFINEIISIKLILNYNIPERYVAIFVLCKNSLLDNSIETILKKEYLKELLSVYKDDENLDKYITALVYQINPDKAIAIVYMNELQQALEKNIEDKLKILKKASFISLILDDVLKNIKDFKKTVIGLDYMTDVLSSEDNTKFWDYIYKKIIDDNDIGQYTEGLEQYQKTLIKNIDSVKVKEYAKYLLNVYSSKNDTNPITVYRIIKDFFDFGIEKEFLLEIQKELKVQADLYDKLLIEAKDNIDLTKFLCTNEELDTYYSSLDLPAIQALESINWVKNPYSFTRFKTVLENFLISNRGNYPTFFDILSKLKLVSKQVVDLSKLPNDTWDSLYQKATNVQQCELLVIGLRKNYLPSVLVNNLNNQSPSEDVIINFAKIIEDYYTFDDLLLNLNSFKKYPIYLEACKKIVLDEIDREYFTNIHVLLENFGVIQNNIQISSVILFKKISQWKLTDSCNKAKCLNYDVLKTAKEVNNDFAKECIERAKQLLSHFSKEDWIKSFKDTKLYGVKEAMLIDFNWTSQSLEALRSVLIDIASDNFDTPSDNKLFTEVVRKIRTGNSIFRDVRDEFCNSGTKMTKEKFVFFAEFLFTSGKLEEKIDSLRKIIPITLLDEEVVNIILDKYSEVFLNLLSNAGEEAEEYKQKILNIVSSNPESILKKISDMVQSKENLNNEKASQ